MIYICIQLDVVTNVYFLIYKTKLHYINVVGECLTLMFAHIIYLNIIYI